MPNEIDQLLNIPSAEAERVAQLLQPRQPVPRPFYSDPYKQSYSDYSTRLNETEDRRIVDENLAKEAEIQRRIALPTMMGRQARSAAYQKALESALYEKKTKALMDDLGKLDPGDPESLTYQDEVLARHPVAREALKDPRIANLVKRQAAENAEMGTLFDSDPASRQEYANLRAQGKTPQQAQQQVKIGVQNRADRLWFATQGGDPSILDSDKYKDPSGRIDRAKLAFDIAQRKRAQDSLLSASERKALTEAADLVPTPSDVDKTTAFQSRFGRAPTTEEEWSAAWQLANKADSNEALALAALIEDLEKAGKNVPANFKSIVSTPTEASVQNVPRGTSEPSVPQNNNGKVLVSYQGKNYSFPNQQAADAFRAKFK